MKTHTLLGCLLAISSFLCNPGPAADTATARRPKPMTTAELDQLVGQPLDIAPWTYAWRANRKVQEQPEAYFIPRRLERIDKVYRTAITALPPDQLKSIYYKLPDLLKPLPPAPKGQLQAALLWTGGVTKPQVELRWPADVKDIPSPDAVEVRTYPTSFGWFGWTVDQILRNPEISADRRTWIYKSDPAAKMDGAYDTRPDVATEMVAVFYDKKKSPNGPPSAIPDIHVTGGNLGQWKRMDIEVEWGFQPGREKTEFDGRLETHVAMTGPAVPLAEDKGTVVSDGIRWKSRAGGSAARRGIQFPLLYAPENRPGLDSRITVWTNTTPLPLGEGPGVRGASPETSGLTFRIADLDKGPIFIPEQGVFIAKAGSGQTAAQFVRELKAKNLKSIQQMTRDHREAASWKEVMEQVRLWTCPKGTALKPFPPVADPVMQVQLPDADWTAAWRSATAQLNGPHMWGGLAFEVGRVAHQMELIGLHAKSEPIYGHFLKSPGVKSDGDYSDGAGALEWAMSMRHDMGYSHDGTHASTGLLLYAMADRYFLTGDKAWFQQRRARLQTAADWIIRQRTNYMKDVPNRNGLHVAGLMPPCMLGDYALPTCDWHWYYVDNVLDLQGLRRFADAVSDFDAEAGRKYRAAAEAYRKDLRRTVDREAALAPVRLGRDGMYHGFMPRMAYAKGLMGSELGVPEFPDSDRIMGSIPMAEPFAVLDPGDYRIVDTLEAMEEMGTQPSELLNYSILEKLGVGAGSVRQKAEARKNKGLSPDDAWFWNCYAMLPKGSYTSNMYLRQDDVPNFLRFWMAAYAAMVGADGKLWEHWHFGNFDPCGAPDNGTAGWFMENFRNMLVVEDGPALWIAKGTPRVWLEQGKKIAVKNAPTYFGTLAYEIVSDADHGKIAATVEMPSRKPPQNVLLRFRHPKSAPIKSVTVNGKPWTDFDPAKETIRLHGVQGAVKVEANYL
jgi:hypothetical protein